MKLWNSINENAGALGIIFVVAPLVFTAWRYLAQKRKELRSERFNIYHRLIKQLVEPEDEKIPIKLDRQLAVVFELRRFPEYFEPSLLILKGLRQGWSHNAQAGDPRQRLWDEIDDTVARIEKKSRNIFRRIKRAMHDL